MPCISSSDPLPAGCTFPAWVSATDAGTISLLTVVEGKPNGLLIGLLSASLQWRFGDAQFGEPMTCQKVGILESIIYGGCCVGT